MKNEQATATPAVKIKGIILDNTGDTPFFDSLERAVEVVVDQTKNFGKWVFTKDAEANFNHFNFTNYDAAEITRFQEVLQAVGADPEFMITGALTGGSVSA